MGYEVPLSGAMLGVSVHAVWQPQVRNKAVYLVVDDAVHTNNTGVSRIARRYRIKASAFLRRTVSVRRRQLLSKEVPFQCPSSMHCSQGHPPSCAVDTSIFRALCLVYCDVMAGDIPQACLSTRQRASIIFPSGNGQRKSQEEGNSGFPSALAQRKSPLSHNRALPRSNQRGQSRKS